MGLEEEIKGKFRNEYHKARINIYYTNSFLMNKFDELMKKYQITSTQYNLLKILRSQYPDAVNLTYIKERMLDRNSDISRILERLFKKNYIVRDENQTDRRQKKILISKDGLDLLAKMDNCEHDLDNNLSNLSSDEVKQLNTILDKMRDEQ